MMTDITLIGLGAMGSALANALLQKGVRVTLWNRSADKSQALREKGASVAVDAAAAIKASPVTLISVLNYAAVQNILENAADSLPGRTLINLTNGTPAQARNLGTWVKKHKADYLDGGVMVTPEMIGGPDALIFYSGSRPAFDAHFALLQNLGGPLYLGDNIALAAIHDLALLSSMFGMFSGYIHAAALLRSENISVTEITPRIMSLLKAMIELLPQTAREIDSGDFPHPSSNNTMMAAALKNILDASAEQGLSYDLMHPISQLFEAAVTAGFGDKDISALPALLELRGFKKTSPPAA